WFQLRFGRKPMLFFGVAGALLFLLGFLVGVVALWLRFGPRHVGFRPLLDLIMVLVISGIALFGFGFVGEMLAGMREEVRALQREMDQLRHRAPDDSPPAPTPPSPGRGSASRGRVASPASRSHHPCTIAGQLNCPPSRRPPASPSRP